MVFYLSVVCLSGSLTHLSWRNNWEWGNNLSWVLKNIAVYKMTTKSMDVHCSLCFVSTFLKFILNNTSNIWTVIKLYSCYLHMYSLQSLCNFFCWILDGVLYQHCLIWVYSVVFKLCNLVAVILLILFRESHHIFTFQHLQFIGKCHSHYR